LEPDVPINAEVHFGNEGFEDVAVKKGKNSLSGFAREPKHSLNINGAATKKRPAETVTSNAISLDENMKFSSSGNTEVHFENEEIEDATVKEGNESLSGYARKNFVFKTAKHILNIARAGEKVDDSDRSSSVKCPGFEGDRMDLDQNSECYENGERKPYYTRNKFL
jgi:hypothetical protein